MTFTRERIKNVLADCCICNEDVTTLLEKLKSHDERTFLKSINTMKMVNKIIKEEKIGEKRRKEVLIGAVLHEIGYLELPPELLYAKRWITADNFVEFKKHPEYGIQIVEKYPSLNNMHIMEIIYCHHESSNGNGYPIGMENVPYYAQLVGAISAFRAMAYESRRPQLPVYQALITLAYEGVSQKIINKIQDANRYEYKGVTIPYANTLKLARIN